MLTGFDYAVLTVIALSALWGAWRGLVAELFSLIGWLAGLIVAGFHAGRLAPYFPATWPGAGVMQYLLAWIVIVISVVCIASTFSALLSRLIGATGLRSLDGMLGLLFGIARGTLLVIVLAMLARFTYLPQQDFWREGRLQPYTTWGVDQFKVFFPARFIP